MPRRVIQLLVGLVLYGAGCALTIEAGLGVDPWTVFAQGLSMHTGIGIGWVTNIVGFLVLLLWIPLRQKPGIGTIANILLVGTSMQVVLWVIPPVHGLPAQIAVLLGGILLVALASGLYIGARFGPGPRDGLMTGMNARLGWPIWAVPRARRGHGARRRLAARRHGRHRHGALRGPHRTARARRTAAPRHATHARERRRPGAADGADAA